MNSTQRGLGSGSILIFLAVVALCLLLVPNCLEKSAKEKSSISPPPSAAGAGRAELDAPGDRSGLLDRQMDAEETRQKADEKAYLQEAGRARAQEQAAVVEAAPAEQALHRATERDAAEAERAVAQVNQILARWGEAKARAGVPIRAMDEATRQDLQSIERAAQTLVLPECARRAQVELLGGMDQYIQGMLASGADDGLGDTKAMLAESSEQMTQQARTDLVGCDSAVMAGGKPLGWN